jgi:hypothetical protein
MIEFLPVIGAALTLGLGILGLTAPTMTAELVGLVAESKLGRSEMRATFGGLFVGLGGACVWLQSPDAYVVVGLGWGAAAVARVVAIIVQDAFLATNVGGILLEGGIGLLLVAGML